MADLIDRDAVLEIFAQMLDTPDYDVIARYYSEADADKAIQAFKDIPAVNRWIPCSECLPENRERVLVCFRSGTVHIAVWYGDYDEKGAWKVTSQFPTKLYRTDTVPKWMPMPEPPEVNEP